jgi:acyl carrier protein
MRQDEIFAALTEVFCDMFKVEDIVRTSELSTNDVDGWDSLSNINLIVAIEQRFGFKTRSQEMEQLNNIGDLVRLIETKTGGGATQGSQA